MEKKIKAFLEEFKNFALKGNVVSMAVGIIIGAAFTNIITAFTNDFINPIINAICGGGIDAQWAGKIPLWDSGEYIAYGDFITAVLNFLIQAFILFVIIKAVNGIMTVGKKPETPAEPTTKKCPYCQSEISIKATKCAFCTSIVSVDDME